MAVCDECGSSQVAEAEVQGVVVELCGLCGHIQGDEVLVERARERREAAERGIDPVIYPLVRALDRVPTFRVESASPGREERSEYPFVFLRVSDGGLRDIERLLTSLEMANRSTQRRWVVECTLQRGLLFILRPRFWKPILDISAQDIAEARADLQLLAQVLARDVKLAWWRS